MSEKAKVGDRVHYVSKFEDRIVSPATVLRTLDSTDPELIERWGSPLDSASGSGPPPDLEPELPSDEHIDLLVHGLGGDYREYNVPKEDPQQLKCSVTRKDVQPRTWHFPEMED